jgi:hypothetical protein
MPPAGIMLRSLFGVGWPWPGLDRFAALSCRQPALGKDEL